jgi:hypothetical protein
MRLKIFAIGALALSVAGAAFAQKQLQLLATISDPAGGKVDAVAPADVSVTEDGKPATITKVEVVETTPKVQILIDNGLGMPSESLSDLRNGLRNILQKLPEGVEVTIVTTAPQPRFLERATTDRAKLLAAVDKLAPDTGAGRFVESLYEASQRIDKDKAGRYTIVTLGTSSGDTDVRERDMQQMQKNIQANGVLVHVVLLTSVNRSAGGGYVQAEVGQAVAGMTGGRFEKIGVANRIPTLLQEIGDQMVQTLGGSTRQFRISLDRPGGASGNLGKVSISVTGKLVSSVSIVPGK